MLKLTRETEKKPKEKTPEEIQKEELDNQMNYLIDLDFRLSMIELGI